MQQTISSARAQEMPPKFQRGRIRESLEDANWSECRGRSSGGGRRGSDDDGNNGCGDADGRKAADADGKAEHGAVSPRVATGCALNNSKSFEMQLMQRPPIRARQGKPWPRSKSSKNRFPGTVKPECRGRSGGGMGAKKGEDEGDDEKTTFFFAWAQETPTKFARPCLAAVGEGCKSLDF